MKKLLLAATVLMGCGPAFPGTYVGSPSEIFACPSGTNGADTIPSTWTITQSGNVLSISIAGGACNPITANLDARGPDSAIFNSKTCLPTPDQFGGQVTQTIRDGDLSLDSSGDLTFFLRSSALFHDPGFEDETCIAADFGLLTRQK